MNFHKFITNVFQENVYIIWDERSADAVILDAGGQVQQIIDFCRSNQLNVHAFLATHCHADHILVVSQLQKHFDAPFCCHQRDEGYLNMLPQQSQMLGLGNSAIPERICFLDLNKDFSAGNLSFSVLTTPGHSAGGISFLQDNHCFVGDTIFAGSIGRTDLPGGDMQTLLESIRKKIFTLPKNTILHPGHGPDTTVLEESLTNPFLNSSYPHGQ